MRTSKRTGRRYPHVEPSKKSLQTVKTRVTGLTGRERTVIPINRIIEEINMLLRGWTGYFHFRNCSKRLDSIREHVEQRIRTHLRKRHKIRNRDAGYIRFGSSKLYNEYGLFRVPTTAGWTQAHALG